MVLLVLVVIRQTTRGNALKKGLAPAELRYIKEVAPRDGFEPPARRLTVVCSTAELPGINALQCVIQNKIRYAS